MDHENFRICQSWELRSNVVIRVACSKIESVPAQLLQLTRGFEKPFIIGALPHYIKWRVSSTPSLGLRQIYVTLAALE